MGIRYTRGCHASYLRLPSYSKKHDRQMASRPGHTLVLKERLRGH